MGGSSSLISPNYDVVQVGHKYLNQETFVKKTGWDGVKAMISYDEDGNVTPQMTWITEGTLMSGMLGGIVGGCVESRVAYERFLRTNQATAFENPHLARRLMYDRTILGFGRGAWRFGWRLTAFSGIFLFTAQAIPAYRAKHTVFDLSAATALAGMAYKFKQGPKPMVAGMALGGLLGIVAGVFVHGVLAIGGLSMDDINDFKRTQSLRALQKRHERQRKLRQEQNEIDLAEVAAERPEGGLAS